MRIIKKTISSFFVESLADGTILVHPRWIDKPVEKGAAPVGVGTRLAVAVQISEILNKYTK